MFWKRLQDKALKMLGSCRGTFGKNTKSTSQEIREEVFRRLESVLTSEDDQKVFPYKGIVIRLRPPTDRAAQQFDSDLVKNSSLESDIHKLFEENQVRFYDLDISVAITEKSAPAGKVDDSGFLFEMEFHEPVVSSRPGIPELHLEIIKGKAEQPVYRVTRDRLLIGSLPEVHDLEGRLVRKNNIVFPHQGNDINATVGNMHARIWFDVKQQEFRVMDESSRYGTRIVREGRTIEVPQENPRGVGLRNGDEVYFGQACFRFTVVKNAGR